MEYRAARASELGTIRRMLTEAIATSPYYDDEFKRRELEYYSPDYLRRLLSIDPWHINLVEVDDEIMGFIISEPHNGVLFCTWSYVAERYRTTGAALHLFRSAIRKWDHGRFHKVSCYVRPENITALKVFKAVGFEEVALLKQHILGHDVILVERPLTRVATDYGYDMAIGKLRRVWLAMATRIGR